MRPDVAKTLATMPTYTIYSDDGPSDTNRAWAPPNLSSCLSATSKTYETTSTTPSLPTLAALLFSSLLLLKTSPTAMKSDFYAMSTMAIIGATSSAREAETTVFGSRRRSRWTRGSLRFQSRR
jgi:hypothetical protein